MNWSEEPVADVPPAAVTVMSTVPVAPTGAGTTIEVALFTLKLTAGVAPKFTAVTPVKLDPVIVTDVPPVVGPEGGLTEEMAGGAT